ncbi:MAG: shikimate kinase [Isosphaeraceae bacterium]|jgi:shikimate kinase|nr:MAG: shikimate kinase [Isosphaeraceae bacterium]
MNEAGLVLIGYRGAGKSTLGPRLAARLGRPFLDLDREIEHSAGRTIAEIFAVEGEPAFRDLEAKVLEALASERPGCVLATGGGAVLRSSNRRVLRGYGLVVWLRAEPGTLTARLAADPGDRPSLTGLSLAEEVGRVVAEREPIYRQLSDFEIETDRVTPEEACDRIAAAWSARFHP